MRHTTTSYVIPSGLNGKQLAAREQKVNTKHHLKAQLQGGGCGLPTYSRDLYAMCLGLLRHADGGVCTLQLLSKVTHSFMESLAHFPWVRCVVSCRVAVYTRQG